MSYKKRERQERINYVLSVAEELFAEKGFLRVSMRQLAQKAEFALGTIYSFFRSKQQIYNQLMEKKLDQFVSFVGKEMVAETSPYKQVEKFIEAKLTFLRNNLSFLRLYLAEIHAPQISRRDRTRVRTKKKTDVLISRLTEAIRKGIEEGTFAPVNTVTLARALDGLTNSFALHWLEKTPTSPLIDEIKTAKEVFLKGILVNTNYPKVSDA